MVTVALLVRLEAKSGKAEEVAHLLRDGLPLVQAEPETTAWFAARVDASTFLIFDVFPTEEGREQHLAGRVAEALLARAADLFSQPPAIEKLDVLASKLPG